MRMSNMFPPPHLHPFLKDLVKLKGKIQEMFQMLLCAKLY